MNALIFLKKRFRKMCNFEPSGTFLTRSYWRDCPERGKELVYDLTERGDAILQMAAARAGIDPGEYLKKLVLMPRNFP
jgi:hypothetical protein